MSFAKSHLLARAHGRCECGCGRALGDYAELDHFFGRAKADENEFLCWILHRDCHHAKTNNSPSAAYWFARFIAHCGRWARKDDPTDGYVKAALEAQKNWDWRVSKGTTSGAA